MLIRDSALVSLLTIFKKPNFFVHHKGQIAALSMSIVGHLEQKLVEHLVVKKTPEVVENLAQTPGNPT